MAALSSAVAPSLASEYAPSNAWLAQDTTDPTGKGPVTTGPSEAISDPANGTATVDINQSPFGWQAGPELAAQAPDYFYESAFPHMGPWPSLPQEGTGKEAFGTLPEDGITPVGYYKVPPKIEGLAQHQAHLPGHDRHSQDVDNAGWEQYTPSGRVAVRQSWEQDYHGVDNFWPVTTPNLARARTADGGNQNVGGKVAEFGGLSNAGGNQVYEAPAPPATSSQQAPAAGSPVIPQWGF
jgi:hypothetical protein